MLRNLSWRMAQRLSVACLLALSFHGEIAAQSATAVPSLAPSTLAPSTLAPSTLAPSTLAPSTSAVPSLEPSTSTMPTDLASASPSSIRDIPGYCYSNLTVLYEDQKDDNVFEEKTYTLCPNTTFNIGFSDALGNCCFDGQSFFNVRKNTRTQCGEDGKSSNNCLVIGGETHILYLDLIKDEDGANVEFAGITFEAAGLVTMFLANAGDISFLDCIFRVRK
jgi:hypothetical protein